MTTINPYRDAARRAAAARERGEVRIVQPTRATPDVADDLDASVVIEPARGWRRWFGGTWRLRPTINAAVRALPAAIGEAGSDSSSEVHQ